MSKQDRQGVRTATDLERKYGFGQSFAEVYNLIDDAQHTANEAKESVDGLTAEEIFTRLTGGSTEHGVFRGADGKLYINANYIQSGTIRGDKIIIDAATITGTLDATKVSAGDLSVQAAKIVGKLDASKIDAANLEVSAAKVNGVLHAANVQLMGDLTVYDSFVQVGGHLGHTESDIDSSPAIHMKKGDAEVVATANGAKLNYAGRGKVYVGVDSNERGVVTLHSGDGASSDTVNFRFDDSGKKCLYPGSNAVNLGSVYAGWGVVYADTCTASTSDKNKKNSIEDLPRKYVDMVLWLAPKRFKMNNGTSDRYHVGFIAQDVEEGMVLFGIDPLEFGGWIKADNGDEAVYMLRYEEFIAILLAAIQDHEKRLRVLEEKVNG